MVLSQSFTGLGNFPSLTPSHQVDLPMGNIFKTSLILMKPTSGNKLFSILIFSDPILLIIYKRQSWFALIFIRLLRIWLVKKYRDEAPINTYRQLTGVFGISGEG